MITESNKNASTRILAAAICFMLFLQTIIMVLFFDVDAVGPMGTSIGCSHVNKAFNDMTGINYFLYDLTNWLGKLAIMVLAAFALLGLVQLIKRRSLMKIDREILLSGGLYLVGLMFYVFFEKVIVNYRPMLKPGESFPEASFPSTHTMLIVIVMGCVMIVVDRYIKKKGLKTLVRILCAVIMAVTVIGRMACGVHWLTDIIGGLFLSAALLFLFSGLLIKYANREELQKT